LPRIQANNARWGYINNRNQWIIPARFEDAKEFKGGRAPVKSNRKWGFVNMRGDGSKNSLASFAHMVIAGMRACLPWVSILCL
jgi:hypothetical protein